MSTPSLALRSGSNASDAAWLAVRDVARIAAELDVEYRLVGGNSVTLLAHLHGASHLAPERETSDADMGVPYEVCADPRLLPQLLGLGYEREDGNRFVRGDGDRTLVIDVLAPSYTSAFLTNQAHGDLVVDEVPGIRSALNLPATALRVEVTLTDGEVVPLEISLPHVHAALIIKAFAYPDRLASKDAVDIWRLLEAANAGRLTAEDWPMKIEAREGAALLHQHFGGRSSRGPSRASTDAALQARIRLLVARVVAKPAS
ncbi:hypothetical protein [Sanguibacter sp. 25GB23B1]|uniref:hypothetical protein n=1 Tax=Sanguibacter sp. 25GB23B1 TaxID=3156067 RepID=UPI0032AEE800